jgi:hypoxia up-regulated 1
LIHENSAAALYYGLERSDEKLHTVIFFNMGSTSTKASLVEYTRISENVKKPIEEIRVIADYIDYSIGCYYLDLKLTDHFANEFDLKRKGKNSIRNST